MTATEAPARLPLFHYTCSHGRRGIGKIGLAMPNAHPLLPLKPLVWMTPDDVPDREANGLTKRLLTCDRAAYRYRVTDTTAAVPWLASKQRLELEWFGELILADLEERRAPELWWVSYDPMPVRLDRKPGQ
jgi:hypothetical protein